MIALVIQSRRATGTMRISARADYAVRATIELAAAYGGGRPVKGEAIATAQGIPLKFLETVLGQLRQAGLVASQRGFDGGYWLVRKPQEVTVADVIRAIDGQLATVRGHRLEELGYGGAAGALQGLWIAARAALRGVVEHVTLAELAANQLPARIQGLVDDSAQFGDASEALDGAVT